MNRFENGFHSFKKAITYLTEDNIDELTLKEIIINFHHSIEVLFKYILFSKNNLFIYNNIDEIINQNFNKKLKLCIYNKGENNSQFFTISFNETIKRTIVICDETIDIYTYNGFKNLNKYRNSLVHDELDLINEQVEQIIISLLPTVIRILENHLPEESGKNFATFINNKDIFTKLNILYASNDKWRLITIINLLTTYDEPSMIDNKHINKMLSLLGCEINEDDVFTSFDGSYYSSTISYLKQQISEYFIFNSKAINKYKINDQQTEALLNNNQVIYTVCKECITNMLFCLIELLNLDKDYLTDIIKNNKSINSLLDNYTLINKIDIYEILFYMSKISQSYTDICCNKKKRRETFLKEVYWDQDQSINAHTIYSLLMKWFTESGWYNELSIKNLPPETLDIFMKNSYLADDVENQVNDIDFFDDLIGEFGEWSSIDNIDSFYIEEINYIIENNDKDKSYTLILNVSISVQTYTDHMYLDNGSYQAYIAVYGRITQINNFSVDAAKYVGLKTISNNFAFK